jgi:hypothetical protein
MMNGEDLFGIWAPADSRWSVWAKPVLFADIYGAASATDPITFPEATPYLQMRDAAVIVDVPGSDSVLYGIALARRGYQPVPLYNGGIAPGMLVNMGVIANFLGFCAAALKNCPLPAAAPPVFLLNADRLDNAAGARQPGRFDNRWCVVPQDMPSAEYLSGAGIRKVVLISDRARADLVHILRRYQDAGLTILHSLDLTTPPVAFNVPRPAFYKSFFYRLMAYSGLRRNSAGGFGAVVPDPQSSGGCIG